MSASASSPSVLKLKVTLLNIKPPIWRRLLAPETMTLAQLHHAIQNVMGWRNGHLHLFEIGGNQFGDPKVLEEVKSETRFRLSRLLQDGINKFTYTYDLGDDWRHGIQVEGIEPAAAGTLYPVCVNGKRACPPEDCGGVWGYQELLEILATPDHPERADRLEWLGRELGPEGFSIENANKALRSNLSPATKQRL